MSEALRLLYLEDDRSLLRVGEMMLQSLGHTVCSCSSAEEARVKYLEGSKVSPDYFDLLVLDLSLEGDEDGLDVYKSIRDSHPGQKCVIVSGCLQCDLARETVEREGCCALPKPFSQQTLDRAIGKALAMDPAAA